MKPLLPLGRLLGIPIGLNPSWFVAFGLVLLLLGWQIYPALFPQEGWQLYWLLALLGACLFFACIVAHEMAHSLVARRLGIPVHGITLFIFGGVARLGREAPRPRAEFLMALVGPLTSLLLGGLFFSLWRLTGFGDGPLPVLWQWLAVVNLGLGVFNLAPGFPMDGGRLLRSLLWGLTGDHHWATAVAVGMGRGLAYLLVGAGLLTILGPGWWPWGPGLWQGLWLILIGFFLEGAARQSYLQTRALEHLRGQQVAQVMSRELPLMGRDAPVAQGATGGLFVVEAGRVIGVVLPAERPQAPRHSGRRGALTAAGAMVEPSQVPVTAPQEDLADLLQRMNALGLAWMPVVEEGRLVGVVQRERILALMQG